MKDLKTTSPIREGFRAITPYLFAENASRVIEFIAKAFGGSEVYRKERSDGAITHAEIRTENSMLMLGEATAQLGPMPASIYLYVGDSDRFTTRRWKLVAFPCFPS